MNILNAHASRRDFLRLSTAAVATGLLGKSASGAAPPARWPIACRDAHFKETGRPDCWTAAKFLGIEGIEVTAAEDLSLPAMTRADGKYTLATDDGLKAFKDDLAKNALAITAFCMHNRLDERLEQEVEWASKLVQAAVKLNVGVIRIDVYPRKVTGDAILPFAIDACKRLCNAARDTSVRFAIENHGKVTNDPAVLEKLFDGVGSEKLGLTMDFLNFYWFGHPLSEVYGIYEKFAPRAFHTHCKSVKYPGDQKNVRRPMGWQYAKHAAAIYEGDIDYRRVAQILRKANYAGDLCLENECLRNYPKEEQGAVLKKEVALLRTLVAA